MPALFNRIERFVRSPQGQRLTKQAQKMARDPRTRRKIEELRGRYGRRAPSR
jgi:hypothetical protein